MKRIMILLTTILGMGVAAWALNDNKAINVKNDQVLATEYHYKIKSTDINDLQDMNNWEVVTSPPAECGNGSELPCVIPFTASTADPDFQTFLNNRNLTSLLAASSSQKSD